MEALISSSSFLPRYPQLLHAPSYRINTKVRRPSQKSKITFEKKLLNQITNQPPDEIPIKNPHPHSKQVETVIKKQSLLSNILNTLDDFICTYLDSPLRPSIDPENVLSGHSAPVDELPPSACVVVEGSLPSSLDGAYIRNGPNPQFANPNPNSRRQRPHHLFEGDGMLHMIKISKGKATLCSRYIRTHKYEAEREAQYPFVPARLVLIVARVRAGQFDPVLHGTGTSNTSLALLGGRLFALCESDLPYEIKVTEDGDILTLGRRNLQSGDPKFSRMTAHPKIDRVTGEAFAYEYNINSPFLTFFRTDGRGRRQKGVPIYSMEECTSVHDFAVTENYAIFPDGQVVLKPSMVWRGRSPLGINRGKMQRLGIIGRYAEDDSGLRWIDTPGLNIMHCVNAWEEDGGDRIVLLVSNCLEIERFWENFRESELRLEKITIDVRREKVERERLSTNRLELGVINPAFQTKKNRYVYAAITDDTSWVGVVKLDLSLNNTVDGGNYMVASRLYGPGCNGGEPFFVPRESNNPAAEEDDGYLITYVHEQHTQESKFLVMDAKSPTLDIVAVVKLPQRVPDGFHGLFVSESDLGKL
ncbi:probable carotenoid cleavage dioxygenase 4 chloroplastic [Phtheirospermum japonicum]|uniref:Probable carotenoid cleavage dioxygenase 4 chloroplastic n=1 Tax=Phtheirospermum japonicum TaxID=374723 RepID=A0A830B400_9LAMI|nr:probable carotenoid cleavage dioxygenase 4 chloroplastic [Phtheirospermum japonicum]